MCHCMQKNSCSETMGYFWTILFLPPLNGQIIVILEAKIAILDRDFFVWGGSPFFASHWKYWNRNQGHHEIKKAAQSISDNGKIQRMADSFRLGKPSRKKNAVFFNIVQTGHLNVMKFAWKGTFEAFMVKFEGKMGTWYQNFTPCTPHPQIQTGIYLILGGSESFFCFLLLLLFSMQKNGL